MSAMLQTLMWWRKKDAEPDEATLLKRRTIMLVDDDMPLRNCIGSLLEKEGYVVVTCGDGMDAGNTYTEQQDDIGIVVLDMKMPKMDGRVAFHELRKVNPTAKVILASGYSVDVMVKECLDAGAVAFLSKPFQTFTLLELIEEHIQDA